MNLSGLEWLSWDETAGISRTDIEAGNGNTFIADGWRYATRTEFEALFGSLWGGTNEGLHSSNFDGASWLLRVLDRTGGTSQVAYFGSNGECVGWSGGSCIARSAVDTASRRGFFDDVLGLPGPLSNFGDKAHSFESWSSALVRAPSAVPLPASAPLLIAGIAGFAALGRRRKRKAG